MAAGNEAWYHADFCHAYAWVYEEGDHLRVKWGERDGENLYLHALDDCERCKQLSVPRHHIKTATNRARNGEFTMEKPSEDFSSTEAFFTVLAEIAKYVPGLYENGAGEDSRSSLPVAPDGPE